MCDALVILDVQDESALLGINNQPAGDLFLGPSLRGRGGLMPLLVGSKEEMGVLMRMVKEER